MVLPMMSLRRMRNTRSSSTRLIWEDGRERSSEAELSNSCCRNVFCTVKL
jgi:hypothetical protein